MVISLIFGMNLSLTVSPIASAGARPAEHYVECLHIGLPTAVADTVPVDLVGPVGGTSDHGQATVVPPSQVNLQGPHAPPFDWLETICDVDTARSTLEMIPNVYVVVPSG